MLFLLLCAIVLGVSADRKSDNGWSMETPDQVWGREGKLLVLFCKYTCPHNNYSGNISIIWKKKKTKTVIFNYVNYPLKPGFANQILVNREERFQPLGNIRENDASIIIKHLKREDAREKYVCRVENTENPGAKFELDHGDLNVTAFKGSSVTGKKGVSATLPCSFKPLRKKPISITIHWMKGNPWTESIVFNHTRSHSVDPPYTNTLDEGGRYELVGIPEQGDASISVRDLRLNDTSDYFCHVWVRNSKKTSVTQNETRLQVVVPATILNLSVVTGVTGDILVCRAEGEPPANITWIGRGNSTLPVNSSEMRVIRDLEIHQTVGKLLHPRLRGNYTCVAMNEHGTDTREINLPEEGMNVLMLALCIGSSISAVVVLLIVVALCFLKKDSRQRGSCVDSSAANGLRSQGAEPDLQLEGDPIYNVADPTAEAENQVTPQVAPTPEQMDSLNDPQESPNHHLYCTVNTQRPSEAEMDPQEASGLPIYSTVQIRKCSRPEQETDPQESPSHNIYSNVHIQCPRPPPSVQAETAVVYATVIHSNKRSTDVNVD